MYEEVCLQLKVWYGSLRPRNLKIVDSTARTICTHLQPPHSFYWIILNLRPVVSTLQFFSFNASAEEPRTFPLQVGCDPLSNKKSAFKLEDAVTKCDWMGKVCVSLVFLFSLFNPDLTTSLKLALLRIGLDLATSEMGQFGLGDANKWGVFRFCLYPPMSSNEARRCSVPIVKPTWASNVWWRMKTSTARSAERSWVLGAWQQMQHDAAAIGKKTTIYTWWRTTHCS